VTVVQHGWRRGPGARAAVLVTAFRVAIGRTNAAGCAMLGFCDLSRWPDDGLPRFGRGDRRPAGRWRPGDGRCRAPIGGQARTRTARDRTARRPEFPYNVLTGVTAGSATDAWAVGYYISKSVRHTLILHWNGTAWSVR
jgi:hypothetical protein